MDQADVYQIKLAASRGTPSEQERVHCGGRILLPPVCLNEIQSLRMVYPLQFKISTIGPKPKVVYAAMLEFTAERGTVIVPDWMADHLGFKKNTPVVTLETCSLSGANIIKLQPHTQDFIALADPRAVLERHLVDYPVLMSGASIVIRHAKHEFRLKITELVDSQKRQVPAVLSARADSKATEVKVEFERPMDMPEEEEAQDIAPYVPQGTQAGSPISATSSAASPAMSFSPINFQPPSIDGGQQQPTASNNENEEESASPSFVPFSGGGHTLAGGKAKPLTPEQIREARLARLSKSAGGPKK